MGKAVVGRVGLWEGGAAQRPPPPGMGSLNDMWGTPPPILRNFLHNTVCILIGVSCASRSVTLLRCQPKW